MEQEEGRMSIFFVGDLNILKHKNLSPIERNVYFCLVSYMNRETSKCFPRYATIAKDLGISRTSIHRAVHHLAKLHLLTIKRKSSTNEYLLTQQKLLEELRIKRVKSKFETSDVPDKHILVKPSIYNYNTRKSNSSNSYYRKSFARTPIANHSNLTLKYKGETYKSVGTEDHWIELENKAGKRILKHKFKDILKEKER